jgi:hypothetical protein
MNRNFFISKWIALGMLFFSLLQVSSPCRGISIFHSSATPAALVVSPETARPHTISYYRAIHLICCKVFLVNINTAAVYQFASRILSMESSLLVALANSVHAPVQRIPYFLKIHSTAEANSDPFFSY